MAQIFLHTYFESYVLAVFFRMLLHFEPLYLSVGKLKKVNTMNKLMTPLHNQIDQVPMGFKKFA